MLTEKELRQKIKVVIGKESVGETEITVFHWRSGTKWFTLCNELYVESQLRVLGDLPGTIKRCGKCYLITEQMNKGWTG